MSVIDSGKWVPTGNNYVVDSLWGRLGVQKEFGKTYISGATNGLAIKDNGNQVFLYTGSVNGGIHLRTYDKTADSWGESWEWISEPGSGYLGSQSIGVLTISPDGQYLAVGQGNPSNFTGVAAPSRGVQIGKIQADGAVEWLPVSEQAKESLSGRNIRSMEWMGDELKASSWDQNSKEGSFIEIKTSAQGIIDAHTTATSSNLYISKGAGSLVASSYALKNGQGNMSILTTRQDGALVSLHGDKYTLLLQEIEAYNLVNQDQISLPARTSTHPDLINGELVSFLGLFSGSPKSKPNGPINFIIRLRIDPASQELIDYKLFSVNAGDIGTNEASNYIYYGNFSLAADPNDPAGNSVFVGGNAFGKASLASPTVDGGLVRVEFSGDEPRISETLYGPKINTEEDKLVTPFSPGQPHADSRAIAFYESKTGPKLIETDDGGIWELGIEVGPNGSSTKSDAWWESLTSKGLNTLETNMVSWASASNSIASSYQDNAASLGYYGDDHASNVWMGDGQLAFFDDSGDSNDYSGYLSSWGYLSDGVLVKYNYGKDGYIDSRESSIFYLQRSPKQDPIPWGWSEEAQLPNAGDVFILPTEANAYKQGSIALSGQLNIYESIAPSSELPDNAILFKPLIESDYAEPQLRPTAIDNQGDADGEAIASLYVGALNREGKPTIYGRQSNSSGNYRINEIDFGSYREAFESTGQVIDIAHGQGRFGDNLYWIQGGRAINYYKYFPPVVEAVDQILGIRTSDGVVRSIRLGELGVKFTPDDPWGNQALVFVPSDGNRPDQLVLGGLDGVWSIALSEDGLPIGQFIQMPWQGLASANGPGSYVKTIQYDPQDDLLIAGTQGQGSYIYSFSGELGERDKSNELLHISDITLEQRSKARADKRGNQNNNGIVIQLNSELQKKDAATEIEIILHDADKWRGSMDFISPYDISVPGSTKAATSANAYLNILKPEGLALQGGREVDGDIIMPFTFPAGVSLYNLIINEKEVAHSQETISLDFSVRTTDGLSRKSAVLELIPDSTSGKAIFNGSSLEFDGDKYENVTLPRDQANILFSQFMPEEYNVISSPVANLYTITPSIDASGAILPTNSKDHETRTTLPIDTYAILRASTSMDSEPNPERWMFAAAENVFSLDPAEIKLEKVITYDSADRFGARFYDLNGDGYADRLSINANASQEEFRTNVALGFGSAVIQPSFRAMDQHQVLLTDGIDNITADKQKPFNIRVSAAVDLGNRPDVTSSIGYLVLNPYEYLVDFSNTLFKERAKTLITSLGESVDLSMIPENKSFINEILVNTGQRVMFFEVEGGSIDQLTGIDDPRVSWLETTVVPDQENKTLSLSNENHTALTVNITPGVQGINSLIADLQNQAPILDFTAFATDQSISGTLDFGREADLNSNLGWYVISGADGAIRAANGDTLLPGDVSYAKEALRPDNLVNSLTGIQINDDEVSSKNITIKGGRMLAPYARVSNGETYFAFAAANSDGIQHFYSLGTNKIGFEDLKGGGDRDYQDLVQVFNFSTLIDPVPVVINAKQEITDKSLIGTENFPHGPEKAEVPIYWPGKGESEVVVNNQPGVISDVAVAFSLTGNDNSDTGRIFVTLISPSGVRIPIAGTTIDSKYLSYEAGRKNAPTSFGLNLKAGESKSFIYSESKDSISNYNIASSIKDTLDQDSTSLSLASLTALKGAEPNGAWKLEVKNSSDAPIQLDTWQLFLKSEEKNVSTDVNGSYRFDSISPSSVIGPVTPWVTLPSDRSLISPTGKLNANIRLGEHSPEISFGLSTQKTVTNGTSPDGDGWVRFDRSSLLSPSTLHPKTTLNQAVTSLEADSARAKYGVNGQGVKIGLLSSSWNALGGEEWDYKTGVLDPNRVTITRAEQHAPGHKNEGNDEGRSMAQILHSIAPGADIDFYSWDDEAFNARISDAWEKERSDPERNKIIRQAFEVYEGQLTVWEESLISLAENGARIMVDDLDDNEPWFEDGRMTKAINYVVNKYGVTYFAAAGNSSDSSYQATFQAKGLDDILKEDTFKDLPVQLQEELRAGHELHLFEGTEGTSYLQSIKGISNDGVTLQWNSKWGENTKSLKVMVFDEDDNFKYEGILDPDGKYPWTWFSTDGKSTYKIAVVHNEPSSETRPGVFKWLAGNSKDLQVSKDSDLGFHSSTDIGHTAGNLSANVGSVQYWSTPAYRADTAELSQFSSWGVTPIYFDSEGNFLAEPEMRQNPIFVVPQKGNTSFFSHGYDVIYDSDGDFLQNFEGTSAAAPNAAAVAALMLELNPELKPSEIIDALKTTATIVQTYDHTTTNESGFNRASGYGLINAMDALDYIAQLNLSGTVYEDSNADGQRSEGERGLEGIQVFLDSNGNGRLDQSSNWQSFVSTTWNSESINAAIEPTLIADKVSGLLIDSRYETVINGSEGLTNEKTFSDNSLMISSITNANDYDLIMEIDKNLTINGDLLIKFDGESSRTAGSYSILKANSIIGTFDNVFIRGLNNDLYFGIGNQGGENIQITVSEDYFVGSIQAGSLL